MKANRRVFTRTLAALVFAPALAAVTGLTSSSARAQAVIITPSAPPPMRAEAVPPGRPGYVWDEGHWRWSGRGYEWVPGHWRPMRAGARWVPGHWVQRGPNWRWVEGYWAR